MTHIWPTIWAFTCSLLNEPLSMVFIHSFILVSPQHISSQLIGQLNFWIHIYQHTNTKDKGGQSGNIIWLITLADARPDDISKNDPHSYPRMNVRLFWSHPNPNHQQHYISSSPQIISSAPDICHFACIQYGKFYAWQNFCDKYQVLYHHHHPDWMYL